MATNIKYFLGTLNVTIGEYSNNVRLLVAANSEAQADEVLEHAAASYYGEGNEEVEDGGYYANHGQVHTKAASLVEIGAATFYELRGVLSIHHAGNVKVQDLDAATEPGFKAFAKATANALKAEGIEVKHTKMLEALASGLGQKNWQVLQAKFQAPAPQQQSVNQSDCEERDTNKHALRTLFDALDNSTAKVQFRGRTWAVDSCSPAAVCSEDGAFETVLRINLDVSENDELAGASYGFSGHSFVNAVVENFTTIVLEDGTRVEFLLPEQEWSANVCRTGYGFADFVIKARTAAEAEEVALDCAGDRYYNEKNSDYEVDWVTPVE